MLLEFYNDSPPIIESRRTVVWKLSDKTVPLSNNNVVFLKKYSFWYGCYILFLILIDNILLFFIGARETEAATPWIEDGASQTTDENASQQQWRQLL